MSLIVTCQEVFMLHSKKDCIACGSEIPSRLTIAVYCVRCRGVAAEIMKQVSREMRAKNFPDASGECVDCGAPATNWDHRYYSLPFEVDPVCTRCNTNRGPALDIVDLIRSRLGLDTPKQQTKISTNLDQYLADCEREMVERAIRISNGNHAAAARNLGINYRSMRYRVHRLGIVI